MVRILISVDDTAGLGVGEKNEKEYPELVGVKESVIEDIDGNAIAWMEKSSIGMCLRETQKWREKNGKC
jgi:hypothetical protein